MGYSKEKNDKIKQAVKTIFKNTLFEDLKQNLHKNLKDKALTIQKNDIKKNLIRTNLHSLNEMRSKQLYKKKL